MKYFFYSRKAGYLGGHKLKVFVSNEYDDPEDKTKEFVDLSGKEMLERNIPEDLKQLCKKNLNWYYYSEHQKITEIRVLE